MKSRLYVSLLFLAASCLMPIYPLAAEVSKKRKEVKSEKTDRAYWVEIADKVSRPVLENLSLGKLKGAMPVEQIENNPYGDRTKFAHLEAIGRTLCGIAPWLELPEDSTPEGKIRGELLGFAHLGLKQMVDSASPDYIRFDAGSQILVDAAFLAQAFVRAPQNLWGGLDKETQQRIIAQFKETRRIRPHESNWLLFSAMIEAFFKSIGEEYDIMRLDYALNQHEAWYKGDGVYGDGKEFHWDYYNSFVIQPMLVDIITIMEKQYNRKETILARSTRYAAILERFISPEGTFPPMGRSLLYRTGCMQTLSQMALLKKLPAEVCEAQVRCALTAVTRRMFEQPSTFDEQGWLTMGFCGHQRETGEPYICTGSLYLCTAGFVALGLSASDSFWTLPAEPWTSCKAWSGAPFTIDHAIKK